MKKRIISMILVIVMVLGMLPTTVFAKESVELYISQMHPGDKGGDKWRIADRSPIPGHEDMLEEWGHDGVEEFYLDRNYYYEMFYGDSLTDFLGGPMKIVVGPDAHLGVDTIPVGHPIDLVSSAALSGGDIYSAVTCYWGSSINGGNFYASVIVNRDCYIYNGTFENTVTIESGGTITGGTFNGRVQNNGTIINDGRIELGPDFSLTGSGKVTCTAHIMQDGVCRLCKYSCTHTGGTATCTKQAVCTICGVSYGDLNADNHTSDTYTDGNRNCCGTECSHQGGTATCTQQAVCDRCGVGYGDVNPDNHVGGTATCTQQAVCDRCGVGYGDVNPDNHIFGEDHCCTNEGCSATEECALTFIDGDTRTEVEAHYHDLFYFDALPDKDGLSFLGWDEDGDGVVDYEGYDYTYLYGSKTYTAIYGAMYLVSYYRIGYDSGEYELQDSVTVSGNSTLTLSYDYAYWYTPLGWATEPGGEKVYDFGQEIIVTDTLNLYTVWDPFAATFNLDGGTWLDAEGNPVPATITEDTEFYTVPMKPGYIFQYFAGIDQYGSEYIESFYTDEETGESWMSIFVNGKITYTAIWEECPDHGYVHGKCDGCGHECTEHWYVNDRCSICGARRIAFRSRFGKGMTMENDVAFPGETFSTKLTSITGKLENPAKIRIGEVDYYIGDSPITYIDGILTIPGELINERVWLYLNAGITITFYSNGGAFVEGVDVAGDSVSFDVNWDETEYRYGDELVQFEQVFVREGYELIGLNSKADGSGVAYTDDTMIPLTQDVDFYAQWRCLHAEGFEHTDGIDKCGVCGYIRTPVTITKQPETVRAELGEKFTISVEAEGDGLTYQWFYKDKGMDDFAESVVKQPVYSFEMVPFRVGRQYYCEITDQYNNTVRTDTVKSTSDLKILTQPQNVEVATGEKVTITVEAIGEGLQYQWYYMNKNGTYFEVSTYKGKTYSVNMSEATNGRQVYCVITDAENNVVKSATVTMTRPPQTLEIVTQPQDVVAENGKTVNITVEAKGDGLTCQWYYKNRTGSKFAASSYKGKTYSVGMSDANHYREVYCIVTDQYGNSVKTRTATMSHPAVVLEITEQPQHGYAAMGDKFKITVGAKGDGLSYQWYYKDPGMKDFGVSVVKQASYSFEMVNFRNGRIYYCVITDMYGNSVQTDTIGSYVKTDGSLMLTAVN